MKKNIMIHVKNNEQIDKYINYLKNGYNEEEIYSKEVRCMIEEFLNHDWCVYLTSIDNVDINNGIWANVYCVNKDNKVDLSLEDVNENISAIIVRVLGSVEGNFNNIKNYLLFLEKNYVGLALNNPKAMVKGMTKKYLTDIDTNYLENIGIKTIPTKIYNNEVSFAELANEYKEMDKYLIKPVSGELSNSLANLSSIDESWLRYKENKVLGWLVQPIKKEIWNGEYQISFLGGKVIYAQKKNYSNTESNIPNQKTRVLERYYPTNKEIDMFKKLIEYFCELYNIHIDICRIDFMKDDSGNPILLEFEMVNPGFFIGYMDSRDDNIIHIVRSIREYCENKS